MSSPVLEAARAEREQLEERCAWHRGQLDRLEQQLEALKEIERLAERLGHGTAGEAPPATAPGGGVSPAPAGTVAWAEGLGLGWLLDRCYPKEDG